MATLHLAIFIWICGFFLTPNSQESMLGQSLSSRAEWFDLMRLARGLAVHECQFVLFFFDLQAACRFSL